MSHNDNKQTLISVNQIKFAYPGTNHHTISLPSWEVAAGENVLLIGDSGSGKSTLLNLLNGILAPNTGTVIVAGQPIQHMNSRQRDQFRAQNIGYVAQNFNLIPYLSAIDNIKLANYFSPSPKQNNDDLRVSSLLSELNLIETQWHRPVNQLSIGQQQRVAIARAIINKPKLLIADEPTSSLDQTNRDNFMSILMAIASTHKMTILFVSHDLSLSCYFDRVDSMSDINKVSI